MLEFEVHRTPSMAGARGGARGWHFHAKLRATAMQWKRCFVQELLACDGFTL